ncbi:DUF7373 family lipoprotein [Corynebacterium sp. 20_84]
MFSKNRSVLALALCTIATTTSLVACSAESEEPAQSAMETVGDSAGAEQGDQDGQFDTGEYRTTPHPGWTMDDKLGPISETNMIGQNTLLPYEVDEDFPKGRATNRETDFDFFTMRFDKPTQEALEELRTSFLTGYAHGGKTENGDKLVENVVYRFVDAESAKKAVNLIEQSKYSSGTVFPLTGDEEELSPLEIPGHADAVGKIAPSRGSAKAVTAHNEFVILTSASHELNFDPSGEADPQAFEEKNQWMAPYMGAFIDKQIPLLDTLPTKKTEQGFGMSDQWQPMDPDDILKYVVMAPEGVDRVGPPPAATNNRMMAGNFSDQKHILTALDQSRVEASAQGETVLFRTKNEASAELLRASMNVIDATGTAEEYDEPQGLPGTKCHTFPTERGDVHSCTLVDGNYFAAASVKEADPTLDQSPEVGGKETTAEDKNDVDPRTKLSQIMAAQHALLKDAPKHS